MESARQDLISRIGEAASRVGLGRTPARIYALLLMSETPLSLDQIAESLGISKASASVDVRGLASLGAARKVWAPETRRDLYEAEGDLLKVVRLWAQTGIARRVERVEEDARAAPVRSGSRAPRRRFVVTRGAKRTASVKGTAVEATISWRAFPRCADRDPMSV